MRRKQHMALWIAKQRAVEVSRAHHDVSCLQARHKNVSALTANMLADTFKPEVDSMDGRWIVRAASGANLTVEAYEQGRL
jgi:hypothetical protein